MTQPKLSSNTRPPVLRSVSSSVPEPLEHTTNIDVAGNPSYTTKIIDTASSKTAKIFYAVTVLAAAGTGCIVGLLFHYNVLPGSNDFSYSNDTLASLNGTDFNTTDLTPLLGANI
ncbi:hypothetical protein [Candidatus Tisiphia endosymbiont of Nemotelus uliginosus]|uniref:hypothetical protein n=1 Tax=Candidatus Tisiphia endosymbiont of Nemotelus uliginosus TaxID=3077926 RepID=UPI0035C8E5A1